MELLLYLIIYLVISFLAFIFLNFITNGELENIYQKIFHIHIEIPQWVTQLGVSFVFGIAGIVLFILIIGALAESQKNKSNSKQ